MLIFLKRFFLISIAVLLIESSRADVLFVADEFPAMQALADRLKSEEKIESTVVSQKSLPEDLAPYSAVVVYIHGGLSEAAEDAFIAYAQAGGKLVLLHHSISSGKRKNARWFEFLGVALPEGEVGKGGYKWIEGVSWELANLNPNHFIMTNRVNYPAHIAYRSSKAAAGSEALPSFRLEHSEVYLNHVLKGARTVLMGLKFNDDSSGVTYQQETAGWVKSAGKGTVIYLMPGHTVKDFENVAYGRIVLNALIYKP